jgi:hypothetical protein
MWVSRRKWEAMEQRIQALENDLRLCLYTDDDQISSETVHDIVIMILDFLGVSLRVHRADKELVKAKGAKR